MARHKISLGRALVEIGSIVFLFYANLLMGEFTRSGGAGKTWLFAVLDILTARNVAIAFVSAVVGFVVFESLRSKV